MISVVIVESPAESVVPEPPQLHTRAGPWLPAPGVALSIDGSPTSPRVCQARLVAPRVLLAPDKFKGTLSAAQVCAALTTGIGAVRPDTVVTSVLVADGGDGMLAAALTAGFTEVPVTAVDAIGVERQTRYATRGNTAVIELAEIAGLALLTMPAPTTATSFGLGQVIGAALDGGATSITVGIGGSASTDGGAGMLQALGARVRDPAGQPVTPGIGLARAEHLDLSGLDPRLRSVELTFACDVDNPLTGPRGAAAIYGPQKGAGPEQVHALEAALAHWAALVARSTVDLPRSTGKIHRGTERDAGAGAAGGIGFGALAVLGATLAPGATLVLDLVGFDGALQDADLVVTGEGCLDNQTLAGKAPAEVARRARNAAVPVVAVTGSCELTDAQTRVLGLLQVYALRDRVNEPEESFTRAEQLLRDVGKDIATTWLQVPT